ncbi:MAG: DMT family transporter [Eubacterium sp.]|uniref:DMT family transporter n=1 Tax=Lachnospira sp. TaxID=2049031 RepID=UPI00402A1E91|nr:DMT family transporter [Eubacterium sp.]
MAGFIIAIVSGALMSIQGIFNTNVTKSSSIWVAAGFVQLTALATCLIMWFFNGRPEVSGVLRVDNKVSLLGGVIGAFITFTVVKSVSELGIAKAEITIVVAQIIVAYLIELFGLFGSKKAEFSWLKLLALIIAAGGVFMFYMVGKNES